MESVKMNIILFVCWIIICGFRSAENSGITHSNNSDICEGDSCVNENRTKTKEKFILVKPDLKSNISIKHITGNSREKEIYYTPFTEPSDFVEVKSNFIKNSEKKTDKLQVFFEPPQEINSTHAPEEANNVTDVTEVTEFTGGDISISTAETKVAETTTVKSNLPTLQPPLATSPILLQINKKSKKICFCDIHVNQCDINCCCDEDCSLSHFKVFTQCNDNYDIQNSNYCYNTNFIFGNNTSHKIVKTNHGLFCIVRENLKVGMNYDIKATYTTLEAFNMSLENTLSFSYKSVKETEFENKSYLAGSILWSLQNGELTPFRISHSSVGYLCDSEINIKYLVDDVKTCFYQEAPRTQCKATKIEKVFSFLRGVRIISNPALVNKSELSNSSKIFKASFSIGITPFLCQSIDSSPGCIKISTNSKDLSDIICWSFLSHIHYQIWHNGSEGITKIEAYIWVKKSPEISNQFLSKLTTEVKFAWVDSPRIIFTRSGNPGYLTGKPILAGKKVQNSVNGTSDKKEAIELSLDPKNWLSVLGSEKGICSSEKRIPVNFRENGQYMCSLKLSNENFSKENCIELQNTIFKLLVGNDVLNETKENYFNKFVATYGNSKVEETGDWVQVLIDSFPIISSQTYFKSNHNYLACKNLITDLYIDVAYSNTGSFFAPQAKILGVSFQFGKHKDLHYYCDTPGCENSTQQYYKLSSSVHFVDLTKPAIEAFAEPLSLEVKLPHDFFYPFFSSGHRSFLSNKCFLILFFSVFL